ncbi:unnamed protein product [Owenia fusiformis]|uniref:Uncharacterized protein n=1 Tax=Owenia fusiformis TaxID=6347 RepID=A0A8J1XJA0_OWEFU|nr:unnamed protein product [Owenia fusiformis]
MIKPVSFGPLDDRVVLKWCYAASKMSLFDRFYRSMLITKVFTRGWGNPDHLKRLLEFRRILSDRESCRSLVKPDYPVYIDKDEKRKDYRVLDGHFKSPFVEHLPGIMPEEVQNAKFRMILPKEWRSHLKPVCIHLAGTGDHKFGRRHRLAEPLLTKNGVASIFLENPYYGYRKPADQMRSSLFYVSDLFVMGGALAMESMALLHWCERQGYGPLALTGVSMGGHMASLAVSTWHKPLPLTSMFSWTSASSVFTQGVMRSAIPWQVLESQYLNDSVYRDEISQLTFSPERAQVSKEKYQHQQQYTDHKTGDFQLNITGSSPAKDQYAKYHTSLQNANQPQEGGSSFRGWNAFKKRQSSQNEQSEQSKRKKINVKLKDLKVPFSRHKYKPSNEILHQDVLNLFMDLMDDCTHMGNYPKPVDPELIILLAAKYDEYVPRNSTIRLDELWNGCEVREMETGHVIGFLRHQEEYRRAILDAFNIQLKKYYNGEVL